MYVGKQNKCKSDLILYLLILLFTEGKVDSVKFKNEFNLSSKTFCRYISQLNNVIYDFGLYHINLYYDRKEKVYICDINT